MPDAIFNGWDGVLRILLIAPAAYVALILILRMSGKRTLAKLNAFDFVVTIAIGSTVRLPWVNDVVKAEATLLVRKGELLPGAMRRQRITSDEIEAAIRQSGGRGVQDAKAVFLETDGSLAVTRAS